MARSRSCRGRAIFAALALAVLAAQVPWAAAQDDTLVFTERFLYEKLGHAALAMPQAMKSVLNGTLRKAQAYDPRPVEVSCLNSVAPPPLNWQMWCPGKDATVTQWVDDVGATHRKIVLRPQPNMTADMAVYFMTPMFPKKLNISGAVFTKHELWHPIDHKAHPEYRLAPGKTVLDAPMLQAKLNESYRSPAGKPFRPYKTEMWVSTQDLAVNLPRSRYVLGLDMMGFQAFTLIVEFFDTPDGMVASIEVILGAAGVGYDKKNPHKGAAKPVAAAANALLFESVMAPYRANGDFEGALDAVTRHVVEEFGNLQHFVPGAWAASPGARAQNFLQDIKSQLIQATQALPLANITSHLFS